MANKRTHGAMSAKTEDDDPVAPEDELKFIALGGGSEVGRSCHILEYKGKKVMLDAGAHPAHTGFQSLPYYDTYDLSQIDLLLITHFHLDHAASLPYVLSKTDFKGAVFMTHPTKAIYKHIMQDSVRVQNTRVSSSAGGSDVVVSELFNEQDVLGTLSKIQTISFNTTHSHNGIRFTPYPAGHVLGACMYVIEIAGLNIMFTGDYSREPNRHLIPASVPRNVKIDCLITESTFGISTYESRHEREVRLLKYITRILDRDGRVLMPVFALGGAQELLLILEDYWERNREKMQKYPIYFASSLARKCMVVYQTYIDSMNDSIKSKFQAGQMSADGSKRGPWDFEHVRALKSLDRFEDNGPCVMLASPGMLQNGVSRTLLERWGTSEKNGVVMTGYSVEGTMARKLLNGADQIPQIMTNRLGQGGVLGKRLGADQEPMLNRRCTVEEETFAAHVDGTANREFIEEVNAPVVILVHGEKHNMARLKSRLASSATHKFKVYNPANCEEISIPFRQDKIARVVGRLANQFSPMSLLPSPPASDEDDDEDSDEKKEKKVKHEGAQILSGVLVQNDFKLQLMAPEDLKEYAGLTTTTILCRQRIALPAAGPDLIKWALESSFGSVNTITDSHKKEEDGDQTNGITNGKVEHADEEIPRQEIITYEIMNGAVNVVCIQPSGEVDVEWEGNMINDGIADNVAGVLMGIETSMAAVRQSSRMHSHHQSHSHENGDEVKPEDGEEEKVLQTRIKKRREQYGTSSRLDHLFVLLESHFGEDALSPVATPRLPLELQGADVEAVVKEKAVASELARLHGLGLLVPGVEVRDKGAVGTVWLEGFEVESESKVLRAGIQVVVDKVVRS
ncbi:endoribonuclease YSH1-like [Teratosphaeria destructans]|uniref:Endoribonuclease YSH1-like n=1 Tax=Teratosphaeria destructans TaxID=418781 RepID=A0A9W7SW29_9PEZI|nr:endoribonuclease YSH1-like [Teratosphaeria destructans]